MSLEPTTKNYNDIINKIVDTTGLATADDSFNFDTKTQEIITEHPDFADYFETRLKDRLNDYVNKPHVQLKQSRLWTNNNCESINHGFKQAFVWKPQSIPSLVSSFHNIVKMHFADLKRSLFRTGNYELFGLFKRHAVTHQCWFPKTAEQSIP